MNTAQCVYATPAKEIKRRPIGVSMGDVVTDMMLFIGIPYNTPDLVLRYSR